MPVIFQKFIDREDVRRNRKTLYVFGDNVQRSGYGGQAAAMRGEPNSVGVRTKYAPSMNPVAYYGEEPAQIESQKRMIDEDFKRLFEHVKTGGIVVWPANGIGTERAELPIRAPTTLAYIEEKLSALLTTGRMFENRVDTPA
jgi:hypothetical protein